MSSESLRVTPKEAARMHWSDEGEFHPLLFTDDQRQEYEAEQARIEREWDSQPR